jgi:hypothetical protein
MGVINKVFCDNDHCENETDLNDALAPTFHRIFFGGSDFEMSLKQADFKDFCSLECLKEWIEEQFKLPKEFP